MGRHACMHADWCAPKVFNGVCSCLLPDNGRLLLLMMLLLLVPYASYPLLDFGGNDVGSSFNVFSISECAVVCSTTLGCAGFVTDANPVSKCWIKSKLVATVPNANRMAFGLPTGNISITIYKIFYDITL